MNQLHIVPSIAKKFGGLGYAALRYSESFSVQGFESSLYVLKRDPDEIDQCRAVGVVEILGCNTNSFLFLLVDLFKVIKSKKYNIIHIHGIWLPIYTYVFSVSKFFGLKVVISPHGSLEPWSLNHKQLKKKVALALYQKWMLKSADLIFVTAAQEFDSVRALNVNTDIAIIPLGVDPIISHSRRLPDGNINILFMSRIHPQKGLMDLVHACATLEVTNFTVLVAGPDEDGHLNTVLREVNKLGLSGKFVFCGPVFAGEKDSLFSYSDLFVLPTRSENFGMVIAEALSAGLPVITTKAAPWEDLLHYECGWWISANDVSILAQAIQTAIQIGPDNLRIMGHRAEKLILEKYTWSRVGSMGIAAYQWLFSNGPKPDFVKN